MNLYEKIKKLFWPFAITNISVIAFAYLMVTLNNTIAQPEEWISLQSIAVLITLISIPLILKKYNSVKTQEEDPHSDKMAQWMLIRWLVINLVICFNACVYLIIGTPSQLICAGIALIFFLFFCKPE